MSHSYDPHFAEHVRLGLSQSPRALSSMYIYDEKGSKLFQSIMELPEYYLTRAEYEILELQSPDIAYLLQAQPEDGLDVVEFGAGDGTKTRLLLTHLLQQQWDFRYVPIDISRDALEGLTADLARQFPEMPVEPVVGDYFKSLEQLSQSPRRKLVLFLGSNVGNFSHAQANAFFERMHEGLNPGDQVLVGFDLKKNPAQILAAYNDSEGVTAHFNQNLLARINRELGGNFDLSQFKYTPVYNPESGEMHAYQLSLADQDVYVEAVDESFHFARWDTIHTEVSRKYSLDMIETFAQNNGYKVSAHFKDANDYFIDSLWTRV